MKKIKWLTDIGILCLVAMVVSGIICLIGNNYANLLLAGIGVILSFIVIGLGEILYHLKSNGDLK